jgi:hypothetical protein
MHELNMRDIGIGPKEWKFQQAYKGLKINIERISDIWTINRTHNIFLAHGLKMRYNLLNFAPLVWSRKLSFRFFFVYSTL